MIIDITLTVRPEDEHSDALLRQKTIEELSRKGIRAAAEDFSLSLIKRSVDARHGQLRICLRYNVYLNEKPDSKTVDSLPEWSKTTGNQKVLIVGSGPAGLFGALRLLENGIRPVIIERGEETAQRKRDIAEISTKGRVDSNSNYCFGEGGAGTFSDGKLYTRSTKRGNTGRILRIFTYFGASRSILIDAHPHIGTDRLPGVVNAMRAKITELGGEFHFNTRCTGFITAPAGTMVSAEKRLTGITAENTKTGEKTSFTGNAVLLATGHSASDIYALIAKTAPDALEAKTFAVGVRIEHPRNVIDNIQYHGIRTDMPAAEYRITAQENGRGVYSFCMCPGGFVVPSATGPDEIVINGMSSAGRDSRWSNAAIVVEIRPEDIPEQFRNRAQEDGCPALAGLYFRTWLEQETKKHGNGQAAPAQYLADFLAGKKSTALPTSSYTPGVVPSRLDQWLPPFITKRLAAGFGDFNKAMKGFICPEALLIATETRTSTPIRILRKKENSECIGLRGLFPAGEGSGYSGGIVSSAIDGENVCTAIINALASRQD
jgi:uncharacterized FAD-dependent dehydrogenase